MAMPAAPSPVSSSDFTVFDATSTSSTLLGPVGMVESPSSKALAPGMLKNPGESVTTAVRPSGVNFSP